LFKKNGFPSTKTLQKARTKIPRRFDGQKISSHPFPLVSPHGALARASEVPKISGIIRWLWWNCKEAVSKASKNNKTPKTATTVPWEPISLELKTFQCVMVLGSKGSWWFEPTLKYYSVCKVNLDLQFPRIRVKMKSNL